MKEEDEQGEVPEVGVVVVVVVVVDDGNPSSEGVVLLLVKIVVVQGPDEVELGVLDEE